MIRLDFGFCLPFFISDIWLPTYIIFYSSKQRTIRSWSASPKLFSGCRHESINPCDLPFTLMDLPEHYSHQPSCWTLMSGEEFRGRRRRSEEPQFKEPQFKEPHFKEPQFKWSPDKQRRFGHYTLCVLFSFVMFFCFFPGFLIWRNVLVSDVLLALQQCSYSLTQLSNSGQKKLSNSQAVGKQVWQSEIKCEHLIGMMTYIFVILSDTPFRIFIGSELCYDYLDQNWKI